MIVFGWLVAFALLLALVVALLSIPAAWRSARGRGAVPFVWPSLATAVLVALLVAAAAIGWYFMSGAGA